ETLHHVGRAIETEASCLAWSPDGSVLAAGTRKGEISFWRQDFSKFDNKITIPELNFLGILHVAWRPDGQLLATASDDSVTRVWTWPQQEMYAELEGHKDLVTGVAWSPDSRFLVSASSDNTLRVWNLAGKAPRILEGHTTNVMSVDFSSCGRL